MNPIHVTKPSMPPFEEYVEEIRGLWETKWLSNRGDKHKQLETKLAERLDAKNISLFANGHVALEVAINAFGFPKGGEVITTAYTHCSTTHSIVRNNIVPVFCDINENDLSINTEEIKRHITEKTVAIVATHVYGLICNVTEIEKIASQYNLKVIYDAAHAFGVTVNGKGVANWGNASMFSCHATKVFNTIEGGITVFNDDRVFGKIESLINFGFNGPEDVQFVSTNARMNEFEAAMGLCNLRHFDEEVAKRKRVADRYDERLSGITGIRLLQPQPGVSQNHSYYIAFFDGYKKNRDKIQEELKLGNIFARKYFYPMITELHCYQNQYAHVRVPVAKRAADTVISLPMYADLTVDEVDEICDIILK